MEPQVGEIVLPSDLSLLQRDGFSFNFEMSGAKSDGNIWWGVIPFDAQYSWETIRSAEGKRLF